MLPGKLTGSNFIKLITDWRDAWNNHVLDHLYSMRIVAGPGIRVQQLPSGIVISAIERPGSQSGNPAATAATSLYTGSWALSIIGEPPKQQLHVNGGGVFCNERSYIVEETTFALAVGYVILSAKFKSAPQIIFSVTRRESAEDEVLYLLGSITLLGTDDDGNPVYNLNQEHRGDVQVYFYGTCEEEVK